MGTCWYCHWGWSKPVANIYKRAVADLGGNSNPLHYSASHVVWEDENFHLAEDCLKHFDELNENFNNDKTELEIVRQSLKELAALPLDIKCVEPEGYRDDPNNDPQSFPPPNGCEMVLKSEFNHIHHLLT